MVFPEASQDDISIARTFVKPDYFITFTCNCKWLKIKSSLFSNEKLTDRPDIWVRVFNINLEALIEDLWKNKVLGTTREFICMKEDQKRDLPHCYILFTMAYEDKPREPSHVDKVVSDEIPGNFTNPKLYDIITRYNIHGPCGPINTCSPCMKSSDENNGIKSYEKNFPKAFHR
ncbi:uncharacterized protein LOC106463283 [Limulus polyphemus]|uniref:Uncharacterized protein LOC106463283 n=1 Tax=Limulus polyphemus TaxID=6850 RepID=A0ABM1BBN2_LIMPO|nr:uncharacterized protein LOC106463283 [Limulus polyphemus]